MLFHWLRFIELCCKVVLPQRKKLVLFLSRLAVVLSGSLLVPHSSHAVCVHKNIWDHWSLQVSGVQPLSSATIYFWVLCISGVEVETMFYICPWCSYLVLWLSMLFLARFLLLINFSNSLLFPSNQSSCFLTSVSNFSLDTLWRQSTFLLRHLVEFQLVSRIVRPAGHPWLLILIVLVASFLIGILSFLILYLTHSLVVDLIITWSVQQLAPLIAFMFGKSGRSRCRVMM